jgi:hypothetical protein
MLSPNLVPLKNAGRMLGPNLDLLKNTGHMLSPNLDLLNNAGHMLGPNFNIWRHVSKKNKCNLRLFFTDVATFSDQILTTSQWPSLALHFVNISKP